MPDEPGIPVAGGLGSAHCLQLVIPPDTLAVRSALVGMGDAPILRSLPEDERGTVEIVLAEVLNNIVEHAYAPGADSRAGGIEVTLRKGPEGLLCQIVDHGRQMPGNRLPEGILPPVVAGNLPEGGFGWHLIRTLSHELDYTRIGGRNLLTFRLGGALPPEQSA